MRLSSRDRRRTEPSTLRYLCAVGGCNSWETRRVDGGISSTQACERLNWQSDTLMRDVTQSSGVSCCESSSESAASPASLKSQACPLPVSPVEPHIPLKGHPICAAGNTVQRSSAQTNMKHNERIFTTASLSKYKEDEVVNRFLKCASDSPSSCDATLTLSTIVPFSPHRLQEKLCLTCFMMVGHETA